MNVWMMTCTTVRMSSTSASTLAAHTSVNVDRICTLLMGNAEVIGNEFQVATAKSYSLNNILRLHLLQSRNMD